MRVMSYAVGLVLLMTKCIPLHDHQLVELFTVYKLVFKTPKGLEFIGEDHTFHIKRDIEKCFKGGTKYRL